MDDQQPRIHISPGRPLLSVDDINRLVRQRGFGRTLAQALVMDEILQSVDLNGHDIDAMVQAYLLKSGINAPAEKATYLEAECLADSDLVERATAEERFRIFRQLHHAVDVESRFLERKLELDQVTYSLIRVNDFDLAAELYQQIKEGEANFDQLAPIYSLGQERQTWGLIGPVSLGAAHPELLSRLRVAEAGQLWEPFFVVDIWLVLRLEQRFPAQLDEPMRQQLEQELFDIWFNERVRLLLAGDPQLPLATQVS